MFKKDEGDYIGCFKKKLGLGEKLYRQYKLTPCFCIGYCNSHNFSFAGVYDGWQF